MGLISASPGALDTLWKLAAFSILIQNTPSLVSWNCKDDFSFRLTQQHCTHQTCLDQSHLCQTIFTYGARQLQRKNTSCACASCGWKKPFAGPITHSHSTHTLTCGRQVCVYIYGQPAGSHSMYTHCIVSRSHQIDMQDGDCNHLRYSNRFALGRI
jgi:hypothetical protein